MFRENSGSQVMAQSALDQSYLGIITSVELLSQICLLAGYFVC